MPDTVGFTEALQSITEGWNSGDRTKFIGGYEGLGSGEVRLENPVGSTATTGLDDLGRLFDDHNPHIRVETERLIVNGNEAVAVMRNIRVGPDGKDGPTVHSVETYRVDPDGSVLVRFFNPNA